MLGLDDPITAADDLLRHEPQEGKQWPSEDRGMTAKELKPGLTVAEVPTAQEFRSVNTAIAGESLPSPMPENPADQDPADALEAAIQRRDQATAALNLIRAELDAATVRRQKAQDDVEAAKAAVEQQVQRMQALLDRLKG